MPDPVLYTDAVTFLFQFLDTIPDPLLVFRYNRCRHQTESICFQLLLGLISQNIQGSPVDT